MLRTDLHDNWRLAFEALKYYFHCTYGRALLHALNTHTNIFLLHLYNAHTYWADLRVLALCPCVQLCTSHNPHLFVKPRVLNHHAFYWHSDLQQNMWSVVASSQHELVGTLIDSLHPHLRRRFFGETIWEISTSTTEA